jgi:shikimate kinase/3-dehydroquinate synthase
VLAERLRAGSGRPLLAGDPEGRMRALLDGRAASYGRAGEALDTSDLTPERVADELARRYRRRVSNDDPSVDVPAAGAVGAPAGASAFVIAPGALHRLGELLTEALPETRSVAVAFDPAVASVAATVAEALRTAGVDVRVSVPLPSGEAAKTAAAVGSLWSALAAAGLDRTGAVVAVGGGATLDAAGFAAATFARGVPLVNVPTTVLAMVDAAVGGKVGIDHAGIKNSVGAFHPARLVVADPNALATLPERARRAGLAEAVKAFVVASPIALDALPALDLDRDLLWVVEQAVRIKAAFVAVDPFDTGARHALNLGHTFAHALESATGFDMPHGEAVAVGLVAAARLGAALGVTPPELEHRVARTLAAIALPTVPPSGLDRDALLRAMAGDKKRRGGGPVFVVPTGDGVELVDGLDAPSAVEALLQPVAAGSRT